jgi:hypothetical protein
MFALARERGLRARMPTANRRSAAGLVLPIVSRWYESEKRAYATRPLASCIGMTTRRRVFRLNCDYTKVLPKASHETLAEMIGTTASRVNSS